MRFPELRRYDTPLEQAAALFVFCHYCLTDSYGHDAWRDFRVQKLRRLYLAERNKPQQARFSEAA